MTETEDARVTILMPAHDEGRYIGEAIQSVLDQSFRAWQLWVLDDGSTDDTRQVADAYGARDARIAVFVNENNLGRTKTLNDAFSRVTTELVARHDADDRSTPQRLAKQVALLDRRPEVGLCSSFMRMMDASGRQLRVWPYPTGSDKLQKAMLQSNCICHGAVLFRAELFKRVGGYRELFHYAEDYDLWLRMMTHAQLEVIPEPLYEYRMHASADSQSKNYEQHCEVELILALATERQTSSGADALDRDPGEVGARLQERLADVNKKLTYYQEQYGHAKKYIAE
ncbi:MAG: glycosyltransferase family 2 protein, partial [Planctomycetota bacterium]